MIPAPFEVIDALVVLFTLSLAAIFILLVSLRPKGILEWAILIKSSSYLAIMLRACAMTFYDLPRNNAIGVLLFAYATFATTWFGIVAYATYWSVRKRAREQETY